jgi:hypothetical protein
MRIWVEQYVRSVPVRPDRARLLRGVKTANLGSATVFVIEMDDVERAATFRRETTLGVVPAPLRRVAGHVDRAVVRKFKDMVKQVHDLRNCGLIPKVNRRYATLTLKAH